MSSRNTPLPGIRAHRRVAALAMMWLISTPCMPLAAQGQTTSAYTAPRTPDGHPDLQGLWQAMNTAVWNLEDHDGEWGVPAGQGVVQGGAIPYLPSALARRQENFRSRATADPEAQCFMVGVPRITYLPYPFQIVQSRTQVTMLYEYAHVFRNIYLNSPHPKGPLQWWMGDSRARWEGETLVVDVVHFGDRTWFDRSGNYHSPALHVVERYTRTSPDVMWYQATIEDPNVFSRPWTISMPLYRRQEPNARLLEYECAAYLEVQRDRQK
jgi:hypothetical protein